MENTALIKAYQRRYALMDISQQTADTSAKVPFSIRSKTLLIMKITAMLILAATMHVSATSYSQKLSISGQNLSLKYIFKVIEKQTGYSFVFDKSVIDNAGRIDLNVQNVELKEVLDYVLNKQRLSYEIKNTIIGIKDVTLLNSASVPSAPDKNAPANVISTIRGIVTDSVGQPLAGASITLKGSRISAMSNMEGRFEINANVNDILVISYVGYETKEVKITNLNDLRVSLKVQSTNIEAIIVTGVVTRKASTYTGATATISGEDLRKVGNQNIIQSLKNIDPAFQVLESIDFGSNPNVLPDIQMRGATSFSDMRGAYQTSPNQPLFIIDGFEASLQRVLDMDMNRVASLTLLKDAAAKSLYGSKGANGVVVIETKVPEKGRLRVSYNGNLNIQAPDLSSYNLLDAKGKLEAERLRGIYTFITNHPYQQQILDEKYNLIQKEIASGVNTYWLSKPLRTGVGQKHALNFDGGDEYVQYNANFSYNNIAGVMKGSNRDNITGGFSLSYRYKNVIFREQLSVIFNKATESPYGSFSEYAKLNPYWRPYNPDGSLREVFGNYNIANQQGNHPIYNPLINATINTKDQTQYTDFTNNFLVEWNVWKSLKLRGRVGVTSIKTDGDKFFPANHTMFKKVNMTDEEFFKRGSYTMSTGKTNYLDADISANYSKNIGKNMIFGNAVLGMGEKKNQTTLFQAEGFTNDRMDNITHAMQYLSGGKPFGSENHSREASALVSLNYSWDNRFLSDLNYRTNGSSLFGLDNQWGQFWSLGLGWNIHNEEFMQAYDFIRQLKLRGSIGVTGSQNFAAYQSVSTYKYYTNDVYDNIVGSYLMGLANPDLKWQTTKDKNIGIDLSLLQWLEFTFDYYVKTTDNLLTPISVPSSLGFISYTENLGKTENKGMESKVNVKLINRPKQEIFLNVFASAAQNTNKIKHISNSLESLNNDRDASKTNAYDHEKDKGVTKPSVRYKEGQSMNAIWAVRSLGIDPATGNELYVDANGAKTYTWNANDQVVVGDNLPKVNGTLGFSAGYKGLTVSTAFYFRLGGQMYNQTLVNKVENADIQYNVDERVLLERWNTVGQGAIFKKITDPTYFTRPSSRFVQDLSELQMTSLNVSYDFKGLRFVKQNKFENVRASFYMNDVFKASTVFTERGIEYPFARAFSFSIQATF